MKGASRKIKKDKTFAHKRGNQQHIRDTLLRPRRALENP